jgi:hypothetical protein
MVVRSNQVAEMNESMRAEYHRKLMKHFRQKHPEITARFGDSELLAIVSNACDKAQSYGIQTGEGTRKFVAMAVLIRPDFDEEPTVHRYLKQPDLDPDFKIITLADRAGQNIREGG